MMHRILKCLALLPGFACCAVALAQYSDPPRTFIGRKFWYEPAHESYVKTEFHRVPNFDKGMFNIQKKTQFEVLASSRGWYKLRLEVGGYGDPTAFVPGLILRSRLYTPKITESYQESFRRAAFFEEDPDIIRKRLMPAVDPAAKPSAPPPWKIRNRGFPPPGSQPPVEKPPAETTPKE